MYINMYIRIYREREIHLNGHFWFRVYGKLAWTPNGPNFRLRGQHCPNSPLLGSMLCGGAYWVRNWRHIVSFFESSKRRRRSNSSFLTQSNYNQTTSNKILPPTSHLLPPPPPCLWRAPRGALRSRPGLWGCVCARLIADKLRR